MKYFCLLFCVAYFCSCAPSRFVKPLGKGEKAINASLGGPLITFAGAPIPIPFTSISGGYGVSKSLTAYGSLHPTSLIFGVLQTELGVVKNIYYNDSLKFGFSAAPVVNLSIDRWEYNFKFWPELDLNAYWTFNKNKNFIYIGASNWFELSKTKGYGEKQVSHWIINPQLGHTFIRPKWNFNIEVKLLAPGIMRYPNVVDYIGVGNKGAIGTYLSITRRF